jgi:hypothetical protein
MNCSLAAGSDALSSQGPAPGDPSQKRFSGVLPPAALIFLVLVFVAGTIVTVDHKEVRAVYCTVLL